jgi:uncharacterized membrane protein YoaK (UPF0700 family)
MVEDTEQTRSLWSLSLLTLANGFLDAHTYLARGGVFANVHTANVIFGAIDTSERKFVLALAHVWPLLAFIAMVRWRRTSSPAVSSASSRLRCRTAM